MRAPLVTLILLSVAIAVGTSSCETAIKASETVERTKQRLAERLDDAGKDYCEMRTDAERADFLARLNARLEHIEVPPLKCL